VLGILPLAHAGHWYHAVLYLAPVIIVVVVLWIQERRERRRDDADEDEAVVEGTDL
jgi:cytochrome c-type biogenesis protein CcmH/NrfF